MKNIFSVCFLFFLCSFSFAQNFYADQWAKVQANSKAGKFKSNLPIIKEIQSQAMKDKNTVQLIRSLQAEFAIVSQTTDDEKNDSTSQFFAQLTKVENQTKGDDLLLFNVLMGEFFIDYFNQNQWRISQRTNVNNQDLKEIESWTKLDFKNYLSQHFADLHKKKNALQQIKLLTYSAIFKKNDDLDYFPTLFDWNAQREIDFLSNTQLFTPDERKSNHEKILKLYSELIDRNTGNPQLYFSHKKIEFECQQSKCKNLLEKLENLAKDNAQTGDYVVEIIADVMGQYSAKQDFLSALNWADQAEKRYPKSKFITAVTNRKNGILNANLNVHYENATLANKPIQIVAEGKNVSSFSLNIYEVKEDLQNFLKYAVESYSNDKFKAVKKTLVRKENYDLQWPKDYKTYATSLEVKPLPAGIYLVEYAVENGVQNQFYFIAGNSRIVYKNKDAKKTVEDQLQLVRRETGKISADENISIYELADGKTLNVASAKTDGKGIFTFPKSKNEAYYRSYLVKSGTNDFNVLQVYGSRYFNEGSKNKNKSQIFIDRGIYRPGQTVYFKVINTKLEGNAETVAAGKSQGISLYDANGEKIQSQTFTTNEFGSYNGNFVLPSGKLNGSFSIRTEGISPNETKFFQVEEYKRPKFEVTFEPVKTEYKFGQTIELKGKVMMFSGVPLSNTNIQYEIKKQDIRWRYFWWLPQNSDNENSILGETKTNESGAFTIKIDLEKDETIEGVQVNNYLIDVSATDINGETQSANQNLKVASVSHYIKTDEIKNLFSDENLKLQVEIKNYNDQNLKKSYQVKLSKFESEQRIFRSNFTREIQDFPQISKTDFIEKFPHDYFSKDERETKIQTTILNGLTKNDELLSLGKLAAGKYELELYNIEGKDSIKTKQKFEVFDRTSLGNLQKPFLKVVQEKTEYQRGEKAKIIAYSAVPNAILNIYLQNGDGQTQTEQRNFRNGVVVYEVNIPEDEGIDQLNLQLQLVALNDLQTQNLNFNILSKKQPLRIETVTFRDLLQPKKQEKWSMKILGDAGEKVVAEVLASMYDQALDQFAPNNWNWQKLRQNIFRLSNYDVNENLQQTIYSKRTSYQQEKNVYAPEFNWFSDFYNRNYRSRGVVTLNAVAEVADASMAPPPPVAMRMETSGAFAKKESAAVQTEDLSKIPVRQNLNETAFFYPNLSTDKDGVISFEFTSPEALTQWKLQLLGHTKDARSALLEKTVVTQKDFSVTPNYPRFLREGDELNLQTKLSSLVNENLNGTAQLQILDAFTNEDISAKFGLMPAAVQNFTMQAKGNAVLSWKLKTPLDVSSIIIKVVAKAGNFSDGEQKAIAVLPNRMLVTDALPIFVKEGQTKTFVLEHLAQNNSTTATNFSNTLELTTNPVWEVMFALPALKNDQNNSADVVFNKWFADVLAAEIFKANPKLKTVFDEYQGKGLLSSNLEKNLELKQLLLEETPWVMQANNEKEQMQKLARLFDANTMRNSIENDWAELQKLQNPDGGFSWYAGYPSSYNNSIYILKNLGKIQKWLQGNLADYQLEKQNEMVAKLIKFVDAEVYKYWDLKKEDVWNNYTLDYLDSRHYWEKSYPLSGKGAQLKTLIIKKAPGANLKNFTFFGLHRAALLFDAYQLQNVSKKLLTYLKETSTQSETQGVYWKQNLNDWGWYSSKTVNHAGALEAFNQLSSKDISFIEELKIWLVTQKEVSAWGSSRGTAEVIFTLLNSGKNWANTESDTATVVWGGKEVKTTATGYLKAAHQSENIQKELATVTVTKPGPGIVQGGLYWQYYEDLDKIKSSENYISITKELYRKVKTINGEELQKISATAPSKVGEKVTVRMILNTDRNMEFIHLKDMRAAGFEPLDVVSGYQYKNGLGYYQSTKDASTNFYIQRLPKGKYVFEYDYLCNASGTFSNGITTLQNYYAPQMNARTQGANVKIGEN